MRELPYVCADGGVVNSGNGAVKTGPTGGSTIELASQPVLAEFYRRRFQA